MNFNSIQFLIFFAIVITIYFLISPKRRWILLLVASAYFYMSFIPVYILILVLLILIDYLSAIFIEKSTGKKRKLLLLISILSTCMVLFIFKYFNFFNANLTELAKFLHWNYSIASLSIILPIGLSFHTFQSLGYVIDVYLGKQKAEKHLGIYAVYVLFFPQLVAGPIERAANLLPQFKEKHIFEYDRVVWGLKMMLAGFFLKIVIADRLAMLVNTVYNNPTNYTGIPLILATVFFAFQIYCDFMGYSLIALGSAKVMGITLMRNFRRPYFSKSISEFWTRWHISLSTWFKDYIYIPLGGNRVTKYRLYCNILIVFTISGLWHGANWTFIIWGILHGSYLVFSATTQEFRKKITEFIGLNKFPRFHNLLKMIIVFILVNIGWIFFRANTVSDAFYILTHLFSGIIYYPLSSINLGMGILELRLSFFLIFFLLTMEFIQERISIFEFLLNRPVWLRWLAYMIIIWLILVWGIFNNTEFIYFQF
jgi:alginate O-acetyltransferase complex protein AlgI